MAKWQWFMSIFVVLVGCDASTTDGNAPVPSNAMMAAGMNSQMSGGETESSRANTMRPNRDNELAMATRRDAMDTLSAQRDRGLVPSSKDGSVEGSIAMDATVSMPHPEAGPSTGGDTVQMDADASAHDASMIETATDSEIETRDGSTVMSDATPLDADITDAMGLVDMGFDANAPDTMVLDASEQDARTIDASEADAMQPDAILVDAALPDARLVDAAMPDAMLVDAAMPDARLVDAETASCDDLQQNGDETGIDCGGPCPACPQRLLTVYPAEYPTALRNPMKGLTTNSGRREHDWATLTHMYFTWNELEDRESDGIDRIRWATENKLNGIENKNMKVIPRVYLHWSRDDQKYWPSDMTTDDYTSQQFQERLQRLVARLGQVWNDDARIAFVELGIFGKWGEHHSPAPTAEMQAIAAEAFSNAFPDKLVSVRHPWREFQGHGFGGYWDSFSHYDQMWPHGQQVHTFNQQTQRYRDNYIGGETAYDWGGWEIQPGTTATDSLADPIHRNFIINTIRWLHCTQLRWLASYDRNNQFARIGAEEVHRAMGYRFVFDEVRFTPDVTDGQLSIGFNMRNIGAAPFYYHWPVQVALLDPTDRTVMWSGTFDHVDIRQWIGGEGWPSPDWFERPNHWSQFAAPDRWSDSPLEWATPPPQHEVDGTFNVQLPVGQYLLALAILDPANRRPNLRFATSWYLTGGYHPVGYVYIGEGAGGVLPEDFAFDDPSADFTLTYGN